MKPRRESGARWLEEAELSHKSGDLQRAADSYRRHLREHPGDAAAMHVLGGLCYELGDTAAAGRYLEQAHRAEPDNPLFLNDLGAFRLTQGDYAPAVTCLNRLKALSPDNAQVHYNLGLALHGAGRLHEAIASFEQAVRLQPDFAEAWYNLGVACQDAEDFRSAEAAYRRAINLAPALVQPCLNLSAMLLRLRRYEAAVEVLERALEINRGNPKIITPLAESLERVGRGAEAIPLLQETLAAQPDEAGTIYSLGRLLHNAGRLAEAEQVYQRALSLAKGAARTCYGYAQIRKFGPEDMDIIRRMEALRQREGMAESDRIHVHYALGKIYDDCQNYDQAFACFVAANRLQRGSTTYDRQAMERRIDEMMEVFDHPLLEEMSGLGSLEEGPLFIVGMPRSGTTLTEQILASHPQVAGGGELLYFFSLEWQLAGLLKSDLEFPHCCRFLDQKTARDITQNYLELLRRHSGSARFVTDKLPANFLYLGLSRVLFPQAPVIHCWRDPLDVCLSIFFQFFNRGHDYANDLVDIGHYYLQYARLVAHWRRVLPVPFLESHYETLVTHTEEETRRLLDFCGLEWDEACLDFYRTERRVATASNWQVRQPLYSEAIGRWKHYERHLAPLLELFAGRDDLKPVSGQEI